MTTGAGGSVLRVGLEHEFQVHADGRAVDFRDVIHELGLGQPNLDPSDFHAYHLPSGAALIADGAEAEIALPPIAIRPGFTDELVVRAEFERRALATRLPGFRFEGGSTHLSVSVRDDLTEAICRLYAVTFSPALMLLMDRRDSPGLLIRPRPGRVELGGEYLVGSQLAVAAAFAVGSVRACEIALGTEDGGAPMPTRLAARVEPAVVRYGWYVDRTAFGGDLYLERRSARLRSTDGVRLSAQQVLESCWEVARAALHGMVEPDEVALVDGVIGGTQPLPSERVMANESPLPVSTDALDPTPYGAALTARERPLFSLAPVMLTWDLAVFLILRRAGGRRAFAAVPGAQLGPFLERLDEGSLDDEIDAYLRQPPAERVLRERAEVSALTLADRIGPRLGLLAPEFNRNGVVRAAAVSPRRPSAWQGVIADWGLARLGLGGRARA